MESSQKKVPRNKVPTLALVILTLVVMIFVIWRMDNSPSASDAYAAADTIDVVPEVSGRIVALTALDQQIMLTQRTVDAQKLAAGSVEATVAKARAAANQTSNTLKRTEPLLSQGFVSAEDADRARTAQRASEADLNAVLLQAQYPRRCGQRRGYSGRPTRGGPGGYRTHPVTSGNGHGTRTL